jgi:ethanolamine utilization protein EutJ
MKISSTANQRLEAFETILAHPCPPVHSGPFYTGVDLGTAYIVTAVVNGKGEPVAGALTRSKASVRDGLVLDYLGAIAILKEQMAALKNIGFSLDTAAAAYPPGTSGRNANAFANVLEAVGLNVAMLTDEPTAAAGVLGIKEGAVVDIGGGTTGISVIKNGDVIYTADEATGGTHVDLVLAGHYKVAPHTAEEIKRDPERRPDVFQIIRPVFQKMAAIVNHHLRRHPVETVYLVGGTSCFPGIDKVMAEETGLTVILPCNPLLVTPLGIAYCLSQYLATSHKQKEAVSQDEQCTVSAGD